MLCKLNIIVLVIATSLFPQQGVLADEGRTALQSEAISIITRFAGTLKPQLKSAMQSSGPVKAVQVCSTQAVEIATALSTETGWEVKRVSLKPRNTKTALPDQWEHKVLVQFDKRQAEGEAVEQITYSEIVDGRYRFMQAQGAEAICLVCHGEQLSPDVQRALKQHYPDDRATGYLLGQIRGAFSLSKVL